jgi:hypothetical protein
MKRKLFQDSKAVEVHHFTPRSCCPCKSLIFMFDVILNAGSISTLQNFKSVEICKEQFFFFLYLLKRAKQM